MKYTLYHEKNEELTKEQYEKKQSKLREAQDWQVECYTLQKLHFRKSEGQDAVADYYLCRKEEKLFLVKKFIQNGICYEKSHGLTREEAERILAGDMEWMKGHKEWLMADFYRQVTLNYLSPGHLTIYKKERWSHKKSRSVLFCKEIKRAIGKTDFFKGPDHCFDCLDQGKVLMIQRAQVTIPDYMKSMIQGMEEEPNSLAMVY